MSEWGNAPQDIKVENSWPVDPPENSSNRYATPRSGLVDDHERPSVERTNNRDLGSGPPPTDGSWDKSYSREPTRHRDDNNSDWKKQSSISGDWNSNNDRKKMPFNSGDWSLQNQRSEERDDNFNPRQKSHQASDNYDTRVSSQNGLDNNNWNSRRPPMSTADHDHKGDSRNSRGPYYNGHRNDSNSRKPSRAPSNDRLTNVVDPAARLSSSVRDELDDESLVFQEVIHNSFSTRQAEKRQTNDEPDGWRDMTKKLAGNQDSDVRWKPSEDRMQSVRLEFSQEPTTTPGQKKVAEKRLIDEAVQTEPIDPEPIVQLVCSKNPELETELREKLFSLGFKLVSNQKKPPVDDLNEPRKSLSTYSPGVANDSHGSGNNYYTRESESRQVLDVPVSGRDSSANSISKEPLNSFSIQKVQDPLKATSAKSPEPWEVSGGNQRKSEIRTPSPGNMRRPPDDRGVSPGNIVRNSSRPRSPEPWRKPEPWNNPDNSSRMKPVNSRGHSPNHAPRDVGSYRAFSTNKNEQENEPHWERGFTPKKVDSRTASPRGVHKTRDNSVSSKVAQVDPRISSPRDVHKTRDSSSSSRVARSSIEAQKNIDPQEVVNKPTEKPDVHIPPPNTDSWDSGKDASTDLNDWRQRAALFEKQLSGQSATDENEKPLKKEREPWENQKSDEPWMTTTHNDNLDINNNNNNNNNSNDNITVRKEVNRWNANSSIKEEPSDNNRNRQSSSSFNNRTEQNDDYYDSSYRDKGSSYDGGRGGDKPCYTCRKPGHIARDCPESSKNPNRQNCYNCNKPGHRVIDCPEPNFDNNGDRLPRGRSCHKCGSPDHISMDCPKSRKASPFVNPEPSGISPEEAWNRLMKADQESDIEDFEKWLEEFAKASPDETFQTIEKKLRAHGCTGRIIALKREGIPLTSCLIDLQGNVGKAYVAQPVFSDTRLSRASGTRADSEAENFQWLADAGFVRDDPSPVCFNCKEKGHNSKDCSMPKKESDRPPFLECQHCQSRDHVTKYCDKRGVGGGDSYGGYNSRDGYGEKDIRGQGNVRCYNCGEENHKSRECPNPDRREQDKFSDNNPYANGTYIGDDRRYPKRGSYDNDGRDSHRRRDYTDDSSSTYDKNRHNASRGFNNNDDRNSNRNRGDFNDDYQQRGFNDRSRDFGQRGNNNNKDRNDFSSREDRDRSRNSRKGSSNYGYDESSSRTNREQNRWENRNYDRGYSNRDKRDDYAQEFDRKKDNYSSRDGQDRSTDNYQKWDTRGRSTSINRINRNNNDTAGPELKKDSWDRKTNVEETSDDWKSKATWNRNPATIPRRNESDTWPSGEKKDSFNNDNRFNEDRRPRGSNNEELRGRSAQTKEVFSSAANSEPPEPRDEGTGNLRSDVWW